MTVSADCFPLLLGRREFGLAGASGWWAGEMGAKRQADVGGVWLSGCLFVYLCLSTDVRN